MKFPGFKSFEGGSTLEQVLKYLTVEHGLNLRELVTGLTKLSFGENFESFTVTVDIPAGAEVAIENKLRKGVIPSGRLILRSNSSSIVDGGAAWTKDFVTLKNTGASDATVTVTFLK